MSVLTLPRPIVADDPAGPPLAAPSVSPVRVLLGRYQLALDRVEHGGRVQWADVGRRRFTRWVRVPASRWAVLLLLTVHVRTRVKLLERRANARVALLKDCETARQELDALSHFGNSLRRTPGAKLTAPLALAGVLLAAFALSNGLLRGFPATRFLGQLTRATVTLDRGAIVDAVVKSHLDASDLLGTLTMVLWSVALVLMPLVPAARKVRQVLTEQPGLRPAEAAGFAALRARRPTELELGLLADACLAASMFVFGVAVLLAFGPDPGPMPGEAWGIAGWCVSVAGLSALGMRARFAGRRPNLVLRLGRRLLIANVLLVVATAVAHLVAH
jgi:hypothetical protein